MEQYDAPMPEEQVRVAPNHPQSERGVLGAMLRSAEATALAIEKLRPEDFYDSANREIFSAMQKIATRSGRIDMITLDAELTRRGKLEAVGGAQYLVKLNNSVVSGDYVEGHIRIVEEKSILRRLIQAAESILTMSYEAQEDTKDILELAEKSIYDITTRNGGEELQPIQPILLNTFELIEQLAKNHGAIQGVPTGYTALDNLLTGLHGGEMILLAGRPAMGKTAIGLNFIENATIRAGKKAAVFSLEMPAEQLAMRMLCTEARVDMQRVRRGQLEDKDWEQLCDAMLTIGASDIYMNAEASITTSGIRSKCRRLQLEHGLDVIMVDYLSLITPLGKHGSRQEEVASISRELKALALELKVPIIALQQLSRSPAGRSNHRPMLSDIRESGAIEQDADVVMFIHREDYYDPDTEKKNIAELIIAKQRNGSLGTVELGWKGEFTWFMDMEQNPKEATTG